MVCRIGAHGKFITGGPTLECDPAQHAATLRIFSWPRQNYSSGNETVKGLPNRSGFSLDLLDIGGGGH